ncbi:MAG: asparagine synthase (glutamine-hydrolyzing) [Chloroflexi bacterium]|nr:asparagine synthase (glutamine-hydrolyzing) [Chloroflexota bacterium]
MCGICGVCGIGDKPLVERMLSTLRHRGPDDAGTYSDNNVTLGHARLSIIDLSEKGRQPMSNENGDVWLAANGEIYNFITLRDALEQRGHRFYSKSDSETIIHAYEEHGLDFINKLSGMFAFALYDGKRKRLILARDPIGKKPLYYTHDGNLLFFASEIKAILEAGVIKGVDEVGLKAYLAYQHTLGERTLFKGIKRVPAGNMLIFEQGTLQMQKYWDIKTNRVQAGDDYFIKKLRALLEESTRLRMIADVPVGAFLSGGIDSAAVSALARPHAKEEFHTFFVDFETASESEYASMVSKHLDTVHHELTISAEMVAKDLPRIAWHYDEPLGDAAIINNYYLSKEAQKYVKVVLAGEGGDELFGGYPEYARSLRLSKVYSLPSFTKNTACALAARIPGTGNIYRMGNRISRISGFFCQNSFEEAHLYTRRQLNDAEMKYLTGFNGTSDVQSLIIYPDKMDNTLDRMLALDCKNLLPEKFLMKADKGTMANSIEERLPLLDKDIIQFAFSIPPSLKINRGQEKFILRKAVEDLLPPKIVNRKKQGFGTPVNTWVSGIMKDSVYRKLEKGELLREFVKKDRMESLLRNFDRNPTHRARTIWTLFVLELWHEVHFKEDEGLTTE